MLPGEKLVFALDVNKLGKKTVERDRAQVMVWLKPPTMAAKA